MTASNSAKSNRPARIDLNADLGEGFPSDHALLERVTSASVSCGAHAGDPASILDTLRTAHSKAVVVGAHPGYPDREGFGRRERSVTADEVERLIRDQVVALAETASREGVAIRFIKPHGALYNQAQREPRVAEGVVRAACWFSLPLLGQPGSILEALARKQGVSLIAEGFPDRRYRPDGTLVPRGQPDAVLHDLDEIEANVLRLVKEGQVATLCLHGDEPNAVANADRVRSILDRNGIVICSFLE